MRATPCAPRHARHAICAAQCAPCHMRRAMRAVACAPGGGERPPRAGRSSGAFRACLIGDPQALLGRARADPGAD
eukprot:5512391-Prymnesium_polylepis.1